MIWLGIGVGALVGAIGMYGAILYWFSRVDL